MVISIISLLSSITIANFEIARKKALWTAARQDLKSVFDSINLCIYGGGVPLNSQGTVCTTNPQGINVVGGTPLCSNDPSLGNWPTLPIKAVVNSFFECSYDPSRIYTDLPLGYAISLWTGYCIIQCGVNDVNCRVISGTCPY